MLPLFAIVNFGLKVLDILPKAFKLSVVLRLKCLNQKLDMEFSLVIGLKITCIDTRYFARLTLVGKFSNLI
jgi:hypothetical protein